MVQIASPQSSLSLQAIHNYLYPRHNTVKIDFFANMAEKAGSKQRPCVFELTTDAVGGTTDTLGKGVSGAADTAGGAVSGLGNVVSGAAKGVTDTAGNAAQGLGNTASGVVTGTGDTVRGATSTEKSK